MIKNYLKIAWRNLWRNKFFSTLNILGLALGMASSILIILWVQNELGMDAFHANDARLFQVVERQYYDGKTHGQYATPGVLADELKKKVPQVEFAAQESYDDANTFKVGDKILKLKGTSASADFFKMFSFSLLQGNANTALNSPVSIAISRKMAGDFFGTPQQAIGKTIRYENKKDFTVTAVFEDLPAASSQKFEYLINWDNFLRDNDWAKDWGNNGPHTYVMLRKDADVGKVNAQLKLFMNLYNKPSKAFREDIFLQKYSDVYLHSNVENGTTDDGLIQYVNLFSIVAVFILLIACINFMNLTTARSVKRAKEIGVRKVVGAVRGVLIRQFMGEAVLLTFIAVAIAILLVIILLPGFNSITQTQIAYPFAHISFWGWLLGLALITGFLSGSYPALFLSSFNPIVVLKGALKLSSGATWFRKGLVIVQFAMSGFLIIGTIVVSKQVNYIQTKDLGYNRENLIYLPLEGDLTPKYEIFKDEALRSPGIQSVSRATNNPTNFGSSTGGVKWEGKDPNVNIEFTQITVGYDFTSTLKLKMANGRDFSRDFPSDTNNFLINEAALKRIGFKNPIGKLLTMWGNTGKIVGILKDFHFNSLQEPIFPLVVRLREKEQYGNILIRTKPGQTKQALVTIERLCKELNPNFTVNYQFSDKEYEKLYQKEEIFGKLSNTFAFLAIFISCLGLLGLAMFTAEQRVKEIGIRKVLGASVTSLFALLSKEFLVLVLIALLIASPLSWLAMDKWLQNYKYATSIDIWVILLSAIISVLIALLTVSFQSAKAALMNPVKSLRSE